MSNQKQPRTAQEAVYAVLFKELDTLTERIESLPQSINESNDSLIKTIEALKVASENYRQVTQTFTNEAKENLTTYVQTKAAQTIENQRTTIQNMVKESFDTEFQSKTNTLILNIQTLSNELSKSKQNKIIEYVVVVLLISFAFYLGLQLH